MDNVRNNIHLVDVTICVPIYGVEKYIERCAISLFEQTYKNISYIFVNDCTKDKSIEILKKVIDRYPQLTEKIRIINHTNNKGLAAARNTAIAEVKTQFLFNVDSDDYLHPKSIEYLVKKQIETNADIVNSTTIELLHSGRKKIISLKDVVDNENICCKILSRQASVNVWGKLIRTSLYHENNINAIEGVNMGEDYVVMPRLAYYANLIANEEKAIYYYDCQNNNSITKRVSDSKFDQQFKCIEFLKKYFFDKGSIYQDAVKIGEIKILSEITINCCVSGKSEYFKLRIKNLLKRTDKKYIKYLSPIYRISFYFPYYPLLRTCAYIGHGIKKYL